MNPVLRAVHAGLDRGLIELKQTFTTGQDVFAQLFWPGVMLVAMFFMRDSTIGAGGFSLGSFALPSVLGMNLAATGLMGIAQLLATEREDGTLLRAKATPHGMVGYLIGKLVLVSGGVLAGLVIVLVPGAFFLRGLDLGSPGSWLTLLWVVSLGLVATLPVGAVAGSLVSSPRALGLITLPIMGLVAVSGIFYPITAMPGWAQWIAQAFPIYWLGLGMRSGLLPAQLAQVEIGQSWRPVETVLVLGVWAVAGLLVAPVVLRRMARRESGSTVAERREKAMQAK
ncbi:ABC transporter permease [Amycolatopsis rhizosphaerae]|uniref:ABC transporter permease n=1 Tax=Amycolatopsis rhizosphaerae TaxID=2053003 RepID=A0A558DJG7_9PSEU|nr:ABC transporter permease [Amycolatopsis rhizosphaerae]TVT61150.1 ABC transporter permease [Amycolatopsis rhizosphaerae]